MEGPDGFQEARELRIYLRTVGDLVRLQILRQLAQHEEMSVMELVSALHVSEPLISWHLSVLRRCDLIAMRRDGRLAYCSLNREAFQKYSQRLNQWISMEREEKNGG